MSPDLCQAFSSVFCDCGSGFEKSADSFSTKYKQYSVCGTMPVHSDASVSLGTQSLSKYLLTFWKIHTADGLWSSRLGNVFTVFLEPSNSQARIKRLQIPGAQTC